MGYRQFEEGVLKLLINETWFFNYITFWNDINIPYMFSRHEKQLSITSVIFFRFFRFRVFRFKIERTHYKIGISIVLKRKIRKRIQLLGIQFF